MDIPIDAWIADEIRKREADLAWQKWIDDRALAVDLGCVDPEVWVKLHRMGAIT